MIKFLSFQPQNDDCDFARITRFQNRMNHRVPTICPERAEIITKSYRETEGEPIVMRCAKAFDAILTQMTIYIEPDSLIIGNQAGRNFAAPVFPEYSFNWVIEELDEFEKRSGDYFNITEETKERLRRERPIRTKSCAICPASTFKPRRRGCCTAAASACRATAISFPTMNLCCGSAMAAWPKSLKGS